MDNDSSTAFRHILQKLQADATLVAVRPLAGGTSRATTALDYETGGRRHTVVVRAYEGPAGHENPLLDRDAKLLHWLHHVAVPVPRLYMADDSGDILPHPYLVMEYIDAHPMNTLFRPTSPLHGVQQMASALAQIHGTAHSPAFSFVPKQNQIVAARLTQVPRPLDELLSEDVLRTALAQVWPPQHENAAVLLHGDFWPGNILWDNDQIVAIIDWEDAALGDPISDVANARLEVLMHYGRRAMDAFTEQYRTIGGDLNYTDLPLWDLYAALRPAGKMADFGLDGETARQFTSRHREFVCDALENLSL